MSSWKEFKLPMVPGVPEAMDAAGQAAGTLSGILDVLASLLDTLSGLVSMLSDPLSAALSALLAVIQELADQIAGLLDAGVHFYLDKGPYFVAGPPDGIAGFLSRWEASFDDPGDTHRPQYEDGQPVSAMFFVVGATEPSELVNPLRSLGMLFGVPALELDEEIEGAEDLPATIEQTLPTPPDWSSVKVRDVLPPIAGLTEVLERVVGMLAVPASYGAMLESLAQVISDKATALGNIADDIQAVVDQLEALVEAQGLYILHAEGDGVADLIENVKSAGSPPGGLGDEAWVAGVCLLGATGEFGPVIELLGG